MRIFTIVIFLFLSISGISQETFMRTLQLMGSHYEITIVANSKEEGNEYIDMAVSEIKRIEKMISSWDANSETTKINNNAGVAPVKVSTELFLLIERALQISKITDGAFDISYAAMDRIWKFDGSLQTMPDATAIKNSVAKVGYKNILLNSEQKTVFLKQTGMKIGFGAIGKGYSADKAKERLMKQGVIAGMINASGDLNCWGKKPDGSSWLVGITNPKNKSKVFSWFPVENSAVVTSGNYEKYAVINGKRYAHIIDPRTGMPASGISSVSVFAPQAELADALATSVFVMGIDTGINMVNQLKGIECIIVDDQGDIHYSENIKTKK